VTRNIFLQPTTGLMNKKNVKPEAQIPVDPDPVGSETFGLVECGIIVPNPDPDPDPDPDPNLTFYTKKSLNFLLIFLQNSRIRL
jgi:hypothetical protein